MTKPIADSSDTWLATRCLHRSDDLTVMGTTLRAKPAVPALVIPTLGPDDRFKLGTAFSALSEHHNWFRTIIAFDVQREPDVAPKDRRHPSALRCIVFN